MNNNGTPCADFEARFCCPKQPFDATTAETVSVSTNAYESMFLPTYDTTTSVFTNRQFEPTVSVEEYFSTSLDVTTENYVMKRWSFEDFGLSEPQSLEELRNFCKI